VDTSPPQLRFSQRITYNFFRTFYKETLTIGILVMS
jgi:hypothetical protein